MLPIDSNTKQKAVDILVSAFSTVPGALWVVKKDKKLKLRVKALCEYCLETSLQKDGGFISSDQKGVALIFDSRKKQKFILSLLGYIMLGNHCIGWDRAWSIIVRERTIQQKRPNTPHLYFWMLAVEDNENGVETIIELRDFAYELSRKANLPICLETTSERNRIMYQRYGFEVYDTWEVAEQNLKIWFMKREVA
ncbi:hypothetical protein N8223_01965 [Bacteroidia bacterium]|nr:hypothetical protein [Bacteroidia bacterium]|tara:strand:+ start:279 stop:863 length:585 start_codon:yes stop_codon:yes gene_type:complete